MGKALFYRQIEVGIESAYEDAGATMACNMMDAGALEDVQAFIESARLAGRRRIRQRLSRGSGCFRLGIQMRRSAEGSTAGNVC